MTGVDQTRPAPAPLDWRRKLLEWLLVCSLGLATIAFPVIVVQAVKLSHPRAVAVMAGMYSLLLAATLLRRAAYVWRAAGLLISLGAVALLGFYRVGFQLGPGIGSALFVVLSGLLLGRRVMLGTFVFTLLSLVITGVYTSESNGKHIAPGINDPTVLTNWLRVSVVYALYTGVLAAAVSFVVDHIERLLAQRTEALARLQAASLLKQEAENALDDAQRTILQMQKLEALGRLAGGVAHDFNNALVVILGYADMLRKRTDDPEELERGFREIINAGNHAAGLTRKLLSFGRRAVTIPRAVAPAQLFAEVESMLRSVLPENIQLSVRTAPDVRAIFADPGEMQQVLLNLCMNARDAMPNGGALTLWAENTAEWVAIRVRDTGSGMDEHVRAHIFEPFFTTKGDRGTGLGLSTVYGIVVQSGGRVLVESEPGRGATFSVLLQPSAAPLALQPAAAAAPAAARSTILVAEDQAAVRGLIEAALRRAGHTVLAAGDGSEALDLARRHGGKIDLLCTDGVMPGTSSTQLIREFRALFPAARVLVCSGHSQELALEPALLSELRYLQKPFTVETLLHTVSEVLDRQAEV